MKPWNLFQFKSPAARGASPPLLDQFESMIGAALPPDYKAFLLEVNGGSIIGHQQQPGRYAMVAIDWQGKEPQETDDTAIVDYVLVVEDWEDIYEEERSNALTVFGVYRTFVMEQHALPLGLIPIARDPGGSLFLLDVAGPQKGAVLFWARDWYDPDQRSAEPYHNVGFIAPSFSAFLEKIFFED